MQKADQRPDSSFIVHPARTRAFIIDDNTTDDCGSSSTFVPWTHLVACAFIYDEWGSMCDHFVMRDVAGRLRFRSSGTWLAYVSRADRTRIGRVLRARFSEKAKTGSGAAPAGVADGSSALWDRELNP